MHQIKRWLMYHYIKDQHMDPKEPGAQNPYRALLFKLTGVGVPRPRLKSAVNTWRKNQRDEIERAVRRVVLRDGTPRSQLATLRDSIARKIFETLPVEEQKQWGEFAKREHEVVLEIWKGVTTGEPSKEPADRQQCIQSLVRFIQPILDLVNEATGWPVTLMTGGPEPAHGGRLNIISLHAGTTSGDIKMNFGRAERARYQKYFVPIYGDFLQKCFSPEECRRWALPDDKGFNPLESLDLDSVGVNFDRVQVDCASSSATIDTAHAPTTVGISSSLEIGPPPLPHSQLPPPRHPSASPPGARSTSRGLTPAPSPAPSPARSPSPFLAQTSAVNVTGIDVELAGLNTAVPINSAPPSSLPTTSGILPSALPSNTSTTMPRKRKNTNVDGPNSRMLKRPKSTGMAERSDAEGSNDMEEDTVHPNGDEHGGASTAGLVAISPQATSSNALESQPK